MGRKPQVPHKAIVDYILTGHSTREAKAHFGFDNDNIANLRVHTAFKRLRVPRPRYQESRQCQFCGGNFTARDYIQRTCGSPECQKALILEWRQQHPEESRAALHKYRQTAKGRQNNIRQHRRTRERGLHGTAVQRWYFAALEVKKSLRKLTYLHVRNPWEYRIHHIQKVASFPRRFTPRKVRSLPETIVRRGRTLAQRRWSHALRAVQTTLVQYSSNAICHDWERAVARIQQAVRTLHAMREWQISSSGQ
jgi:hypothetical protein